ncbi:MAG: hypothetical protein AB1505_12915 [Candidatus Latescibacterota bacterium]
MRRAPIADLQVGDVLSEPLCDAQGRSLLPRGARLTAAVIARLPGWGVTEVGIEGDEPDAARTAHLRQDLEERFAGLEDDPLMARIKEVARRHLAEA